MTQRSKSRSTVICIAAYVVAFAAAGAFMYCYGAVEDLWSWFWADVVATVVVYFAGLVYRNASLYDPYWSVIPLALFLGWWFFEGFRPNVPVILCSVVVLLWAVRLTANWWRSWAGLHHEDWRYIDLRTKTGAFYPIVSLLGIHLMPTVLVFIGMIPAYKVIISDGGNNWLTWVAFVIGLFAVWIAWRADEDLKAFVRHRMDQSELLQSGVWKYSRHPNYFGELLFWLSLFLFALSVGRPLLSGLGFALMLILFLFISIPMIEKRMMDNKPGYQEYKSWTSMLVPWWSK